MAETTKEFVDNVVSVKRVTKVTKGGKRFSFSAFVVTGDQKGKVGIGIGKSKEVSSAIAKATARARKSMMNISLRGTTLPYNVMGRHGSAKVIINSAYKGTGVIAGGAVRLIMESLGVKDVLAKSIGSTTGMNVVKATLNALSKCRSIQHLAKLRGKSIDELKGARHDIAK